MCVVCQIWAGWHYRNAQCNHNLSLWLWVNGVAWLAFLTIFALSVLSSSGASEAATFTLAACFPCFACALCVAGPFLFIWFVLGNIWVFGGGGVRQQHMHTRQRYTSTTRPQCEEEEALTVLRVCRAVLCCGVVCWVCVCRASATAACTGRRSGIWWPCTSGQPSTSSTATRS